MKRKIKHQKVEQIFHSVSKLFKSTKMKKKNEKFETAYIINETVQQWYS